MTYPRQPVTTSVCPSCKHSPGPPPGTACPKCGRSLDVPELGGEDLDLGGGLDLSRGGAHGSGPGAYSGGGVGFGGDDDPFADEVPKGSLELDLPRAPSSARVAAAPGSTPGIAPAAPASASDLRVDAEPSSTPNVAAQASPEPPQSDPRGDAPEPAPPPPPEPASLIARYPTAPAKVWETPAYAMKVLFRQLELRQDLTSLRRRRSPDVRLYERALELHDARAYKLGLAITCAVLTVATVLFFLPVILRFVRDPS